jgi:LacI family transcriptional regulator
LVGPKVTLGVLAERTGFDKSTISRALRDDPTLSIRAENLALIKRTAEALGYRPDPAGRSLKASRSYALGAVVPSLQNQIHAQIVEGAQSACLAAGYSLLVVNAEPGRPQRELYRQLVEKHRVEGLLVLTLQNEAVELPELTALGVPVVMVNRRSEGFGNFVVVAERAGGELATSYLIDIGHRRIAHLSGEIGRFNAGERFQGYRDALEKAGIAYDPDLVEPAGYSFEQGAAAMERLLDRCQGGFTAVFVVTLMAAAGAISVLRKRGVAVPGDVSVMAFHDGLLARAISPTLTTIAYPLVDMGEAAAKGMIDILEKRRTSITTTFADGRVVERESTAPIRL